MSNEEAVTGSKMKMKIKFISPSPISSVPATATSASTDSQEHTKEPQHHPNCKIDDSDALIPAMALTNCSPFYMGKRKPKPKKMDDGIPCLGGKKRRRVFSKSDHVGLESTCGPKTARRVKSFSSGVHNPDEVKTPAMIRAEEFQSTLSSEFPCFTKLMVRSHVNNGFWMGVPGHFSKEHLPRTDTTFIMVDESGKEYQVTYNGVKRGLSAGWRKFSVEQKLCEDDVLIFQLVEPCKFEVYVVRAFTEVDGALSLLNLDAHIEPSNAENHDNEDMQKLVCLLNKKKKARRSVPRTVSLAKKLKNGHKRSNPNNQVNFEDFNIIVDGLCIDSELPEDARSKYFDLCSMRNEFLHSRLIQGLNSKLVAGVICQTVDISDAIKSCSIMTCRDQFANWEKTLKSFELLGMRVGFLRDRVRRLIGLGFESDEAPEMRKYVEAKLGSFRAEDEIIDLETKIVELKEEKEKYSEDIEALKLNAESFELKFQEEVDAPW